MVRGRVRRLRAETAPAASARATKAGTEHASLDELLVKIKSELHKLGPLIDLDAIRESQGVEDRLPVTERTGELAFSGGTKVNEDYATQVEVLRRLRNGGQQFVRVEHVHINDGGQAIIGNARKPDMDK